MAVSGKFLPFVNESTPVDDIYIALLKRSKGIPSKRIASIYCAILTLGITHIRKLADELTKKSPDTNVYDLLANSYTQLDIPEHVEYFWKEIVKMFEICNLNKKPQLEEEDFLNMFVCIACMQPEKLVKLGFDMSTEELYEFCKEDNDIAISELESLKISSDGIKVHFTSVDELKAFIAFHEVAKKEVKITPVYGKYQPTTAAPKSCDQNPYEQNPYEQDTFEL